MDGEPAVFDAFAAVGRGKGSHAKGRGAAQLFRHPCHHGGDGAPAVFQDGVDQGGARGCQRQRHVPPIHGVLAPDDQTGTDQPVADAGCV